jgi:hypothetical protein
VEKKKRKKRERERERAAMGRCGGGLNARTCIFATHNFAVAT